jgi:hypothetical protein
MRVESKRVRLDRVLHRVARTGAAQSAMWPRKDDMAAQE